MRSIINLGSKAGMEVKWWKGGDRSPILTIHDGQGNEITIYFDQYYDFDRFRTLLEDEHDRTK